MPEDHILRDFPALTRENVRAAIRRTKCKPNNRRRRRRSMRKRQLLNDHPRSGRSGRINSGVSHDAVIFPSRAAIKYSADPFVSFVSSRDAAMRRACLKYGYTMAAVARQAGVHYST
jgi:hypothetical protein